MNEVDRMMLLIKSVAPDAHLEFSEWTRKWYVTARIEVSDGTLLRGLTEHRDGPAEAVIGFFHRLSAVDYQSLDEVLVVNAHRDGRKHYRWNGAAFVEEPLPVQAVAS